MSDADDATFLAGLQAHVGATGTAVASRDAVNEPMIRHWCDAMEDANPNYTDPEHASGGPHGAYDCGGDAGRGGYHVGRRVRDDNESRAQGRGSRCATIVVPASGL